MQQGAGLGPQDQVLAGTRAGPPTDVVLDEIRNGAVPAASLLDTLAFVKRWPGQHRSLAFQGNIHELADADFASIERAIERAERKGEAA